MSLVVHVEEGVTQRKCSDCQLCCKLVPVRELGKLAGHRCRHQKAGKGCKVYRKRGFPSSCALWSCRWLVNDDAGDLRRPDRSHYVLDIMPDFIRMRDNATGETKTSEVVQIWVDPNYPDAHRDPDLRAWLDRRQIPGLIRFDDVKGFVLFPPSTTADGHWHEQGSDQDEAAHTPEELIKALGGGSP